MNAADINIISQLDRAAQNNPNIIRAIVESSSPDFRLSEVWQAYAE
ncbi:MAG: hypothetical protein OQL19_06060 [Gammaproteobacteria bacterium]|nr:hypothetical protein [Gammaproteobacteria bacterium]